MWPYFAERLERLEIIPNTMAGSARLISFCINSDVHWGIEYWISFFKNTIFILKGGQ